MCFWSCLLGLLLWISACSGPATTLRPTPPEPPRQPHAVATAPAAPTPPTAAPTIKIATFNVQVFGRTKAFKPDVMSRLIATIHKYDVVALQELKDASGEAPRLLLAALNRDAARSYAMLLSHRSGLEPDDARSQEQYAILYDTQVIEALAGERLFDDSARDLFQREPYLARLRTRAGSFSFVLMNIHTRPERAVAEIAALHDVFDWAKLAFPDEENFIALGDYNAACRYATPAELDSLSIRRPDYFWIVPDDSDSNVSPASACAYDRIVVTAATSRAFTGRWGVDRAFNDKLVSDHWPVWAEFSVAYAR